MAEDPSILVIGPRWVGDMVMAQCLFSALRDRFPQAAIDVVAPAWASPLVSRMPEVRARLDAPFVAGRFDFLERIKLGWRLRGRYDAAYVLPGSWKSALVPFAAGVRERVGFLREMRYGLINRIIPLPKDRKRKTAEMFYLLAGGGSFRTPHLNVDTTNQKALFDLHHLNGQQYVAFMPGAEFGAAKRWPAAHYAALAQKLLARGKKVVLLGSPKDANVATEIATVAPGVVDLTGKTRLEDAIDLLAGAMLAVCNDSGLMHIAAAVDTPVVALFGSTSYENTPPLTENRELVSIDLACSPCHKRECPLGHLDCLNKLSVERVMDAVDRLFQRRLARTP